MFLYWRLCCVLQIKDKGTAYPVAQILVNCANAYDKKEVEPELVELAKFAKHHIPEEHEMDDQDFVDKRIFVSSSLE